MPSAITHMLFAKTLHEKIENRDLKDLLQAKKPFLIAGSVGPDLPYATAIGADIFFANKSKLADKFHAGKTNELALLAFERIKKVPLTMQERDAFFCFFAGFSLHIIGDGIVHPFIRDKVGDYFQNQAAHRKLEMQLDVIYLNELNKGSGKPLNLNNTNIHDELKDILTYPESNKAFDLFSRVVSEIYGEKFTSKEIARCVECLHLMLDVAEGEHPGIYRNLPEVNSYLFKNLIDLEQEAEMICTLTSAKGCEANFLHIDKISFLDDCVPKFFKVAKDFIEKSYSYIYKGEQPPDQTDLFPIDLDTGRLTDKNHLDLIPSFWEVA